jgi:hypothetical protein
MPEYATNIDVASLQLEVAGSESLTEQQKKELVHHELTNMARDSIIANLILLTSMVITFQILNFANGTLSLPEYIRESYPTYLFMNVCLTALLKLHTGKERFNAVKALQELAIEPDVSPFKAAIRKMFIGDSTRIFAHKLGESSKKFTGKFQR